MPFLAPLVPLALGAIGVTGVAASIATAAIGIGLSFASQKLAGKKSSSRSAPTGVSVGLRIDANAPRQFLVGQKGVDGSLAYWQLSGADNKILHMVIALADHECDSLQSVIVDGKNKSWNDETGVVSGFNSKLKVRFYSGAPGQTADAAVVAASDGRWTNNEKGASVCYVVVEMEYDEATFPQGIPEFRFVVRGAKLYDPRTGLTAYSDNPAVALYNVLRGFYAGGERLIGMNVPAIAIRASDFEAAANACDELMPRKAGGNEKRYRCNVILDCDLTSRTVVETILATFAGDLIETGGLYRIMAGVAQAPVATLTDADLIVNKPLTVRPKRPRTELVNAIQGAFTDPTVGYTVVPLPARTSTDDEDADNGLKMWSTVDLVGVTSRSQAQRIQEIERRKARRQMVINLTTRARWFVLEPGDWIEFTSARRGLEAATFQIDNRNGANNLTSELTLGEVDAELDDWSTELEIDDNQVIDLKSAGPGASIVAGVEVYSVIVEAGVIQRPGLNIQWTPITDPTVIGLRVEFRKIGDTVALTTNPIQDPSAGSYTWVGGVQSGADYEARIILVTMPQRAVTWSAWTPANDTTGTQIVPVAAYAENVNPENLPPAELSAQEAHELELVTKGEETFGAVNQRLAEAWDALNRINDVVTSQLIAAHDMGARIDEARYIAQSNTSSLASQVTALSAQLENDVATAVQSLLTRVDEVEGVAGTKNRVFRQEDAPLAERSEDVWYNTGEGNRIYIAAAPGYDDWEPADDDRIIELGTITTALASASTTLATRVEGAEASAFALLESIDGIRARQVLGVNANGNVAMVDIEGNEFGTSITFVGDTFYFAHPDVAGGAPTPIIAIRTVGGVNRFVFKGQMITDAILSGEASFTTLSAISSNLGTITAGLLRSADNLMRIDLNNKSISIQS